MSLVSFFRNGALTERRTQSLHQVINGIAPIATLQTEWRFYVELIGSLDGEQRNQLQWLLAETFGPGDLGADSFLGSTGIVIEIGPRPGTVTPWSSNVEAICQAVGLTSVGRIERTWRYGFSLEAGHTLSGPQLDQMVALLHDRMTEAVYPKALTTFASAAKPPPVTEVPLLEQGIPALEAFARQWGLALSPVMMDYLMDYFVHRLRRNPTDVEIFCFGQLNSEHCRHHYFNATFVIDGVTQPSSLLDMIRSTVEVNRGNVAVAFTDNAAVVTPQLVNAFQSLNPAGPSPYGARPAWFGIVWKVETHNHPTGVCAYPGAATGMAGRRDTLGTGRGAVPVAHAAGYYVGNLCIPGYPLPWEQHYAVPPPQLETPLQIIIEASNGASDNANCFGNPVVAGCFTSFEQLVDGKHYGYIKPVFVAESVGYVDWRHIVKVPPAAGMLLVQTGGPAYRIGLGGASGSSQEAGAQSANLDFDSVQRANAAMEHKNLNVYRACSELGDRNPIRTTNDLGAGGLDVGPIELVHPAGAAIERRQIPCGDPSMSVLVITGNESQERMAVLIEPDDLELFKTIAQRFDCPVAVLGTVTGDGKLILTDREAPADAPRAERTPIDVEMSFLLADLPKTSVECRTEPRHLPPLYLPSRLTVAEALDRVLRHSRVCCRKFLTDKADRSVTGLIAQQQTVGPLQLPLADCAVLASGFFDAHGIAKSIGEQPIKGLVSHQAGTRMSIGEALTNLAGAVVEGIESVNLSATWQWPCRQSGEDARLFESVAAAQALCQKLGIRIPVGKDSISMTARTQKDGQSHLIRAPGTVQMIATAPCRDITKTVTPHVADPADVRLLLISGSGLEPYRLGGSALALVFGQLGDRTPDVNDLSQLQRGFGAVQELVLRDLIVGLHDRSDGGLISCLLEIAFASNCGLTVNYRRPAASVLESLFNEELGWVVAYRPEAEGAIRSVLKRSQLHGCRRVGELVSGDEVVIHSGRRETVFCGSVSQLRTVWQETSFQLDELQSNPITVEQERTVIRSRQPLPYSLSFAPAPTPPAVLGAVDKPKVAVLCEQGTNGNRELAAAFALVGFEAWDVQMADLMSGQIGLDQFHGLALPGGFSYADALDAGKGWAGAFRFNARLSDQLQTFLARSNTFVFGPCNGCQLMLLLGIVPWRGITTIEQPRFIRNTSERFESRFPTVEIQPSNSIFLRGMAGSRLGIWVAHGEGRLHFPSPAVETATIADNLAPIRYVDDVGNPTMTYPFNPNGSLLGIAGLTSPDGRCLAMMPHPERLALPWQWPYWPSAWRGLGASPWLRLFQNAFDWCRQS